MSAMFLLSLLCLVACVRSEDQNYTLHVLVLLPTGEHGTQTKHTREAFLGVCEAAGSLQQFQLVPVSVPVVQCQPEKGGLVELWQNLQDPAMNVVAVTGLFCDKETKLYSSVVSKWAHCAGTTAILQDLTPSSEEAVKALFSLLHRLRWTRFAILYTSETHNIFFVRAAFNMISSDSSQARRAYSPATFYYQLRGTGPQEITLFLEMLESRGIHISVLLMSRDIAAAVMQVVVEKGLTWPQYVWIFVGLQPSHLCQSSVWENVLFLSHNLENWFEEESKYSCVQFQRGSPWTSASYRSLVFERMYLLAQSLNFTSLPGARCKHLHFPASNAPGLHCNQTREVAHSNQTTPSPTFTVAVVKNNKIETIGQYSNESPSISLNDSLLLPLPPDRFEEIELVFPSVISIPFLIWLIFLLVLLTASLSLFLVFRREPEVKATSVRLSICIFVGCYLLLLSTFHSNIMTGFVVNEEHLRYTTCNVEQMSASVGLDLIIATALLKSIRIYKIFHHLGKLKKSWSDGGLLVVIGVIISIKVALFVLWMTVDINHLVDVKVFQPTSTPPYYLVVRPCYSEYQAIWVVGVYLYTVSLLLLLLVFAVKTRKISHPNFKDTKKTALVVVSFLVMLVVFGLFWGVLRQLGQPVASNVLLNVGYTLGVLVIQVFLFLPKVLPPLCRRVAPVSWTPSHSSTHTASIATSTVLSTVVTATE